jgi:hypothetical protein
MVRDIPFEPANEANETYGKPRLSLVAFSMDFTTGSPPPPAMVNWQHKFLGYYDDILAFANQN